MLFGLNLIVSVAVGYLLDQALLGNWSAGAWCLAALGAAAAVCGYWLWQLARSEAAEHGVILNIAAGPGFYRQRREAEQSTLSAWAANRYPTSVVMSLLLQVLPRPARPKPEEGSDTKPDPGPDPRDPDPALDSAIGEFGVAAVDKVLAAAVLAPGARRFVILPAGVPEAVVQVAAGLWPLLGTNAVLASDVTSDEVDEPFFTFGLPTTGSRRPDQEPLEIHESLPIVGLLRERKADDEPTDAQPTLVGSPPSPLQETSVQRFGDQTDDVGFVPENADACRGVLAEFAGRLPEPAPPQAREGRPEDAAREPLLYLVSDAPEALAFGAGMIAARSGWRVGSAIYDSHTESYPKLSRAAMPDLSGLGTQLANGSGRSAASTEWHRRLRISSAFLAVGVPLAVGAAATLLEWGVARSQGPISGTLHLMPCWLQASMCGVKDGMITWIAALVVLGAGIGLLLGGSRVRQAIVKPQFVVDARAVFPAAELFDGDVATRTIRAWRPLGTDASRQRLATLADRLAAEPRATDWDAKLPDDDLQEWRTALREAGSPYVDWIQARLVDILTAFPAVEDITLRIPETGYGPSDWPVERRAKLTATIVRGVNTGFRGNQPITLECGQESELLMPRAGDTCRELANGKPEIMAAAILAMSRM